MNFPMNAPSSRLGSTGMRRCVGRVGAPRVVRVEAVNGSSRPGPSSGTRAAKDHRRLRNPAHLWAKGTMSTTVKDYGGASSLEKYMRLPVEQYSVLDPKLITMLDDNKFQLRVPRIDVMNVWIEPTATVKVTQPENPPRVNLKTETCEINGSRELLDLQLDGRFYMVFEAELQWDNGTPTNGNRGKMIANSSIDVWCEIEPPFNLMPKEMLESTCNVAMDGLMKTLLPIFMSNLSNDYRQWATSETYRTERAQTTWATLPSQTY